MKIWRSEARVLLVLAVAMGIWIPGAGFCESSLPRIEGRNTIVDQAGRAVKVTRPFTRIISLYGAHTENLFSLGARDQLIGVGKSDIYPAEVREKVVFSYHDGPERFLAARPDLILIRPMIDRAYQQLFSRLEQTGITVVSLQPKTVSEMFLYWKILGILVGKPGRAEQMIERFKNAVAACHAVTASIVRPKYVYFEAIHSKMKTFSPQSMAIFALTTAGGVNVASDARTVGDTNIAAYGKEKILSHADRIDVYLAQYGPMNHPSKKLIRNEPGFQIIKAVKDDCIYIIDEELVSRPTMRLLTGIFTIGNILYPKIIRERTEPP